MNKIAVKKIITHESPDIDAILSVLLLKRFGEEKFIGIKTADVSFCPAGKLPQGKAALDLEKEGILAVDIGGGRFDTHPTMEQSNEEKRERCASDLVAEALGVINKPGWSELIEFTRQHDTQGRNIRSNDFIHHLPTILTILDGFQILFKNETNKSKCLLNQGILLLEPILEYAENRSKENSFDFLALFREFADQYLNQKDIDIKLPPPEFESFVEWRRRLHEEPENAFSNDPLDEIISLPVSIKGLWYKEMRNKENIWKRIELYFDAIIARETQWVNALTELNKIANVYKIGKKIRLVTVASENGMIIKAARFRHRADMVIYREPKSGATSFLIKRNGPLKKFSMPNLAAKVRTAECFEENSQPDHKCLRDVGMIHGWFLHQSENLLIRGSQKTNDFIPSRISLEKLAKIAISEIDWQKKIPTPYCPDDKCLGKFCLFYCMFFLTCKKHRQYCHQLTPTKISDNKTNREVHKQTQLSGFGEKLINALQEKPKKKMH